MPGTIFPLRNVLPGKYEPVSRSGRSTLLVRICQLATTLLHRTEWQWPSKGVTNEFKKPLAAPLALGIVLAAGQLTPTLQAQSQSQAPSAQQDQQKTQTFVGKVVKLKDGRFALLTDEQAGKGAYLDDPQKAAPFEGKNVKVTGILEVAKSLIHISNIEPA